MHIVCSYLISYTPDISGITTTALSYIISLKSSIAYITTYLTSGWDVNDYTLLCQVETTDIFGSSSYNTTHVIVIPSYPNITISRKLYTKQYAESYYKTSVKFTDKNLGYPSSQSYDSVLSHLTTKIIQSSKLTLISPIIQYISIGTDLLLYGSANCSLMSSSRCSLLHREPCGLIQGTCGKCLDGYVSIFNDYGTLSCTALSSILYIGQSCSDDVSCITGYCSSGVCQKNIISLKPCPNSCSGNGFCGYYNLQHDPISSCEYSDLDCYSKCHCYEGRGIDCSLSNHTHSQMVTLKQSICSSMYTLANEYTTTTIEEVYWRITMFYKLFTNVVDLSDYGDTSNGDLSGGSAGLHCILALSKTVLSNPLFSADDSIWETTVDVYSQILAK